MSRAKIVIIAVRAAIGPAAFALLTACGGNSNTPLYAAGTCNPGTQVQLISPSSGQTAVGTNTSQIEIVANGSGNFINSSPGMFFIGLTATSGSQITSGGLTPYSDSSAPHPYTSDFYYVGPISGLVANTTYGVKLGITGSTCTPITLGSFST